MTHDLDGFFFYDLLATYQIGKVSVSVVGRFYIDDPDVPKSFYLFYNGQPFYGNTPFFFYAGDPPTPTQEKIKRILDFLNQECYASLR